MWRRLIFLALFAGCCPPETAKPVIKPLADKAPEVHDLALPQEKHLKNLKQLTFGADNAEAYWSFGGDRLIFQTNHAPYACDQIEVMPANGGSATRVSTGDRKSVV